MYTQKSPVSEFFQWLSGKLEGFSTQSSGLARCPTNYRFFNDQKGDSMCCAGSVDPETHMCLAKGQDELCAFIPGLPDPRFGNKTKINVCKTVITNKQQAAEQKFCPKSLPHHANSGKCCANPSNPNTGDCIPEDLQKQDGYCLTTGKRREADRGKKIVGNRAADGSPVEKLCSNMRNLENAVCPTSDFFKIEQPLDNNGTIYTVCSMGPGAYCLPEKDLQQLVSAPNYLGRENPFRNVDVSKSILNCNVYKKIKIDKDLTFQVDYTDGRGKNIYEVS